MLARPIKCPKCASATIYRVPSHREPLSLLYVISLGWWLYLILPAIPSKFRCDACGHFFRRYTAVGWLYLGILAAVVLGLFLFLVAVVFSALLSDT